MFLRVGVDVGGTNTDAALVDTDKDTDAVLSSAKVLTSVDVTEGVELAIKKLLEQSQVAKDDIKCITIGSTCFINAIVGRDASKLRKVGVIRLASSDFTKLAPPFIDFPSSLANILRGHTGYVSGGLNIDGLELGSINEEEVVEQCELLRSKKLSKVVLVGTFSPLDDKFCQEERVKSVISRELPDIDVICSAKVGQLGLLARENAAILNASLLDLGRSFLRSLVIALQSLGLFQSSLFLSCNDGTMIAASEAIETPVKVIASGPSNSMIGASFLNKAIRAETYTPNASVSASEQDNLIVIDIGGSTTDAGVLLKNGYPRQASAYSTVGKVQVNFAKPDVESIGLGGGSIVRYRGEQGSRQAFSVGPDSMGLELGSKALCFGGNVLTATDVVIAAGDVPNFGTAPVKLEESLVTSAKIIMKQQLEELVDSIKTKAEPLPVALVGGGSILLQSSLKGTTTIVETPRASVANAVGAAVASLSITIDRVCPSGNDDVAMVQAIQEAEDECVAKGADRQSIKIIAKDLLRMPYMNNQIRVIVQVTGDFRQGSGKLQVDGYENLLGEESQPSPSKKRRIDEPSYESLPNHTAQPLTPPVFDFMNYRPTIHHREWILSETDLEWLSLGAYILGCAGGGNPNYKFLQARELLRQGHKMRIIDVKDLPEEAILLPAGQMGTPMVELDRPGGNLLRDAVQTMLSHLHLSTPTALICEEVGGKNGIGNLILCSSSAFDVPMVDGDLMGRAFPTFDMISLCAAGIDEPSDLLPVAISSGDGTNIVMQTAKNIPLIDKVLRGACVEMGCAAGFVHRPISTREMARAGILRSHSLAWRLGRAVKRHEVVPLAEGIGRALIDEFGGEDSARMIFEGKIVGVRNVVLKGHSHGQVVVEGWAPDSRDEASGTDPAVPSMLVVTFQNENLIAKLESSDGSTQSKTLATVPDLIMLLDSRSGQALGVPEYRYGLKVVVIVAAAHPIWTTERGLKVGGPGAFALKDKYMPIGRYTEPKSVIDEFEPMVQ